MVLSCFCKRSEHACRGVLLKQNQTQSLWILSEVAVHCSKANACEQGNTSSNHLHWQLNTHCCLKWASTETHPELPINKAISGCCWREYDNQSIVCKTMYIIYAKALEHVNRKSRIHCSSNQLLTLPSINVNPRTRFQSLKNVRFVQLEAVQIESRCAFTKKRIAGTCPAAEMTPGCSAVTSPGPMN